MHNSHRSIQNSVSLNSGIELVNHQQQQQITGAHTGNSVGVSGGATVESLPKQFVLAMRTLFDIMDDKRTGFVNLADIENRWQDDGSKGLPRGVIDSLRKVTPSSGLLSFERFCAGLKICLLRNQTDGSRVRTSDTNAIIDLKDKNGQRPPSAPLLDLEVAKPQWNNNNTAAVRPNNAMPAQRALSLPQLSPDSDFDMNESPPIIPSLYAPPKPPRTAAGLERINQLNTVPTDRLDKAEIRNALQNWQMGVIMNDLDSKEKRQASYQQNGVVRINRGTADGQTDNQPNGLFQKKPNVRKREPRRHTLQNGIDYNMLKRLKQFEQEKDVLLQGLSSVEKAREWYLKQIGLVQDKIKYLGRMGSHVEQWSEAQQERLDLQRARVLEVNRHLAALAESWERGGFPLHMNLAVRHPSGQYPVSNDMVNRLKQQNRQLTEEVSQKSERITALEREKSGLIRELVQNQRTRNGNTQIIGSDEVVF